MIWSSAVRAAADPGDGVLRVVGAAPPVLAGPATAPTAARGAVARVLVVGLSDRVSCRPPSPRLPRPRHPRPEDLRRRRPPRRRRRRARPSRSVTIPGVVPGVVAGTQQTSSGSSVTSSAASSSARLLGGSLLGRLPSWRSSSRSSWPALPGRPCRAPGWQARPAPSAEASWRPFRAALLRGFSTASGTWKSTAGPPPRRSPRPARPARRPARRSSSKRSSSRPPSWRSSSWRRPSSRPCSAAFLAGRLLRARPSWRAPRRSRRGADPVGASGRLGGLVLGHVLLLDPAALAARVVIAGVPGSPGRSIKPSLATTPSWCHIRVPFDPCRGRRPGLVAVTDRPGRVAVWRRRASRRRTSSGRPVVDHLRVSHSGPSATHSTGRSGSPISPVPESSGPWASRVSSGTPTGSSPATDLSPDRTSSGRTAGSR